MYRVIIRVTRLVPTNARSSHIMSMRRGSISVCSVITVHPAARTPSILPYAVPVTNAPS